MTTMSDTISTIVPHEGKGLPRHHYRSHIMIVSDILRVIMEGGREGVLVSWLSRRSNLAHNVVVDRCQQLIKAGLLETKNHERTSAFVVTEKGIQFSHQIQEFIEIAQTLDVRI